jgi:hypothetical protein
LVNITRSTPDANLASTSHQPRINLALTSHPTDQLADQVINSPNKIIGQVIDSLFKIKMVIFNSPTSLQHRSTHHPPSCPVNTSANSLINTSNKLPGNSHADDMHPTCSQHAADVGSTNSSTTL